MICEKRQKWRKNNTTNTNYQNLKTIIRKKWNKKREKKKE